MKITHCKLSKKKQRKLLEYFLLEVMARSAAHLLGIQENSATLFYRKIREVIVVHLEQESHEYFGASIELDESYFGTHCSARGTVRKVTVFDILKRGRKVYTQVVSNTQLPKP